MIEVKQLKNKLKLLIDIDDQNEKENLIAKKKQYFFKFIFYFIKLRILNLHFSWIKEIAIK